MSTPIPAPAPVCAPTLGRLVHYRLPATGVHRPAIITKVWGTTPDSCVNLRVFTDPSQDGTPDLFPTSVTQGENLGCFHFPEQNTPGT